MTAVFAEEQVIKSKAGLHSCRALGLSSSIRTWGSLARHFVLLKADFASPSAKREGGPGSTMAANQEFREIPAEYLK